LGPLIPPLHIVIIEHHGLVFPRGRQLLTRPEPSPCYLAARPRPAPTAAHHAPAPLCIHRSLAQRRPRHRHHLARPWCVDHPGESVATLGAAAAPGPHRRRHHRSITDRPLPPALAAHGPGPPGQPPPPRRPAVPVRPPLPGPKGKPGDGTPTPPYRICPVRIRPPYFRLYRFVPRGDPGLEHPPGWR
jgi:hypothetical protein